MVLGQETTQEQYDNIELNLSEQRKQEFYKNLKDTNAYEQWRANIHRQLEEDLQRQVQQVLEETERQERLAKLRRQYLRIGQRLTSQQTDNNVRLGDSRTEIDRRNQRILYPLNAKDSYGTQNYHSTFNYQKNKLSSNSFNLESYNSFCRNQRSLHRNDEHLLINSTNSFQDKRTLLPSNNNNNNNNSTFLYGNSIIKTNKADILNILEQQSNSGKNSNTYINKYGIIIDEDGPFWPEDFRIFYPTPKLLCRELSPKEFYLTVNKSLLSSK